MSILSKLPVFKGNSTCKNTSVKLSSLQSKLMDKQKLMITFAIFTEINSNSI